MFSYVDAKTKTRKVWHYLIILEVDHFQEIMTL